MTSLERQRYRKALRQALQEALDGAATIAVREPAVSRPWVPEPSALRGRMRRGDRRARRRRRRRRSYWDGGHRLSTLPRHNIHPRHPMEPPCPCQPHLKRASLPQPWTTLPSLSELRIALRLPLCPGSKRQPPPSLTRVIMTPLRHRVSGLSLIHI